MSASGDGLVQAEVAYRYRSGLVLEMGVDLFYGDRAGLFGQFAGRDRITAGVATGF